MRNLRVLRSAVHRLALVDADDQGGVTVEAAFAICSLLAVLVLGLGSGLAVTTQIRCLDAATEAARLYARGADDSATEAVRRIAGPRAEMDLSIAGAELAVTVAAPLSVLPGIRLTSSAFAMAEPGLAPAVAADGGGSIDDHDEAAPTGEAADAGAPADADANGNGNGTGTGTGTEADTTDTGGGATSTEHTAGSTSAVTRSSEATASADEEAAADDPDPTGILGGGRG